MGRQRASIVPIAPVTINPCPRAAARSIASRVATLMHRADGITMTRASLRAIASGATACTSAPVAVSTLVHRTMTESYVAVFGKYEAAAGSRTSATRTGEPSVAGGRMDGIGITVVDPANRTGPRRGLGVRSPRAASATDSPTTASTASTAHRTLPRGIVVIRTKRDLLEIDG